MTLTISPSLVFRLGLRRSVKDIKVDGVKGEGVKNEGVKQEGPGESFIRTI